MSKHPYYRCKNKTCARCDKSIQRDHIEGAFKDTLRDMRPSAAVRALIEDVVRDCHRRKAGEHARRIGETERDRQEADQRMTLLTARLVSTDDPALVRIYEEQVKALELRRQLLAVEVTQARQIDTSVDGALGTVLDFIENPLSMWENGDLEDKRLVLKLAFAKPVTFDKETGLGTAVTSLPFTVFRGLSAGKEGMVEEVGFEPTNS